ncbi:MAG: universal stress protein [Thermoplasmata archaeon]
MSANLFPTITVATDGSATALEAVDVAIDIARRYAAELTLLSVAPIQPLRVTPAELWVPVPAPTSDLPTYRRLIDETVRRAREAAVGSVQGICLEGVPLDEIVAYVERTPPALLVMGSRGLSRGKRLLLGSVSTGVVRAVKCPVLMVHPGSTRRPST